MLENLDCGVQKCKMLIFIGCSLLFSLWYSFGIHFLHVRALLRHFQCGALDQCTTLSKPTSFGMLLNNARHQNAYNTELLLASSYCTLHQVHRVSLQFPYQYTCILFEFPTRTLYRKAFYNLYRDVQHAEPLRGSKY